MTAFTDYGAVAANDTKYVDAANAAVNPAKPLGERESAQNAKPVVSLLAVSALTDARERRVAELIIANRYSNADELVVLDSRDPLRQLYTTLAKYSRIEQLVVVSHGQPGVLVLAGKGIDIGSIARQWDGLELPTVGQVKFEGCYIGKQEGGLEAFGKVLRAVVSARRWKMAVAEIDDTPDLRSKYRRFLLGQSKDDTSFWIEFYHDGSFAAENPNDPFSDENPSGVLDRSEAWPKTIDYARGP